MNKLYSFVFARAHHGFKQRGLLKVKARESANNSVLSKLKRTLTQRTFTFSVKRWLTFLVSSFPCGALKKVLSG